MWMHITYGHLRVRDGANVLDDVIGLDKGYFRRCARELTHYLENECMHLHEI
jgi:hypothetical protein